MLNLSVVLENSARNFPNKPAFTFGDKNYSFAQINGAANQIANGLLASGILPGDKVALSCLNLPYFPMIYFGILKAGAVVVPLSVLLKQEEVAYHLTDSEAKAFFCFEGTDALPMGKEGHAGFAQVSTCDMMFMIPASAQSQVDYEGVQLLSELMTEQSAIFETAQTGGEDTAVIIYTSGTTGRPKGAELTHSNLLLNAILSKDILEMQSDDKLLIVLPLFHIFAMTVLMNAGLYNGVSSVLLPRFDAEAVLKIMQEHAITIFAGVPTMYWGLMNHDASNFDLEQIAANLKIAISGGASLPLNVLEGFETKFKVEILEGYGMSEGSPVVTFNQRAFGRKPGSVGVPVWGVEVMLVDENGQEVPTGEKGELIYRGHNVTKGYYKKPEANAKSLKNGWLYSGDVAVKDEDGFYYIVDRTKDMIIRGGLNVYPREVEEVIIQHEAVSLVAVIGVPNDQYGEEIKAYVVLHEPGAISEDELINWTKERIAAYKYPRTIEFLEALPMSATGKILKKELRG